MNWVWGDQFGQQTDRHNCRFVNSWQYFPKINHHRWMLKWMMKSSQKRKPWQRGGGTKGRRFRTTRGFPSYGIHRFIYNQFGKLFNLMDDVVFLNHMFNVTSLLANGQLAELWSPRHQLSGLLVVVIIRWMYSPPPTTSVYCSTLWYANDWSRDSRRNLRSRFWNWKRGSRICLRERERRILTESYKGFICSF